MPSLNNEVDILTVGGVDQDIRDTYTRQSIAPTEPLGVASIPHKINEVFYSNADRRLYKCLTDIAIGTTFTPDVNVKQATLSDMMYQLFAQSPEELMEKVLGNYEKTDTASRNYHNGETIIWKDGFFYRVVGSVNIGTPWVVDSNIIADDSGVLGLIYSLENDKDGKTVLSQRLTSGSTSLTFTDNHITDNSLIEVYTDIYGKSPTAMTQSEHTVTLTFKAQAESMTVKLVIREE